MTAEPDTTDEDEIIATLSDYLDGALPAERRAEVDRRLATEDAWKRAHAELRETRNALSGLQKARAPDTFTQDVTATIHKRSAGRFFARRTFGDRVPFGALLVLALLGLIVIAYVMWSSQTGSLKVDHGGRPTPGSSTSIVPTP
jgi:anti-sigma factor RsiW